VRFELLLPQCAWHLQSVLLQLHRIQPPRAMAAKAAAAPAPKKKAKKAKPAAKK
jgi:hypothetical protein